jgi:hypothetical protein
MSVRQIVERLIRFQLVYEAAFGEPPPAKAWPTRAQVLDRLKPAGMTAAG